MKNMMKYLDDVESFLEGDDLQKIKQMIVHTRMTMDGHIQTCDKVKGDVDGMNTEGLETMMEAGLIDKDAKAWVTK